jgi:hypothetical protein
MTSNYNLDYEDDDDDESDLNVNIQAQKPSTWQLQDIEKVFGCGYFFHLLRLLIFVFFLWQKKSQLKEQTSALLDPKWKEQRNQHLIHKMLELDQPTFTVKVCIAFSSGSLLMIEFNWPPIL